MGLSRPLIVLCMLLSNSHSKDLLEQVPTPPTRTIPIEQTKPAKVTVYGAYQILKVAESTCRVI